MALKRLFDIVVSLLVLIVVAPLMVILALAVRRGGPGPVFYRGPRVGRGGRLFRMWKFRSMVVDADRTGASSTARDDARITRVGRWMRRYKLDELPQLFNVIVGDMSL